MPTSDIFQADDFIEATPESLARVAHTIIRVSEAFAVPAAARTKVITGQSPRVGSIQSYKQSSRAASSTPNLNFHSSPGISPISPTRKRWSPPSPGLSEIGSSDYFDSGASDNEGPPLMNSLVARARMQQSLTSGPSECDLTDDVRDDVFRTTSRNEQIAFPSSNSTRDSPVTESPMRQSMISSVVSNTTAHSSLLDHRHPRNNSNKFATIRTMTTEATSLSPSDAPSYSRTEASAVAAYLAEDSSRKSSGRDRKPSDSAVPDLSRVAEEEEIASRPSSKSGNSPNNHVTPPTKSSRAERVHLGKGIWPDDFIDAFSGASKSNPIPIKPRNADHVERSLSVSPPRKLAYAGAQDNAKTDTPAVLTPRRPSHRSRHSVDPAVLMPKDSLLSRDVSPTPPRPIARRSSSLKPGPTRSGGLLVPRKSFDEQRPEIESRNGTSHVPFPSGDESPGPSTGAMDERGPRGRFASEVSTPSGRRPRPISFDDLGKHRRSRYESMVNLGAGSNSADLLDNPPIREILTVTEDGKPSTHFVSNPIDHMALIN